MDKKLVALPACRVIEDQKNAVQAYALANDRSVSWVIRAAIECFLDAEQARHEANASIFADRKLRGNAISVIQRATEEDVDQWN